MSRFLLYVPVAVVVSVLMLSGYANRTVIFGGAKRQKRLQTVGHTNQHRDEIEYFDKFLISSSIYFGRISNAKLSLVELVGLSLLLNRTLVVPKLEECGADGVEAGFDTLFDPTGWSRASVISAGSFDFARVCGDSAVFVGSGSFPGHPMPSNIDGVSIQAHNPADLLLPRIKVLSGPESSGGAVNAEPFVTYFSKGLQNDVRNYMKEPLLPDKLLSRNEKCVVLGRNFLSVNWARMPSQFKEANNGLLPHASIRADVDAWMMRNALAPTSFAGPSSSSASAATAAVSLPGGRGAAPGQFLGIHLRMKDFLSDAGHRSFGARCNDNPNLLVDAVKGIMDKNPSIKSIVLASDDYGEPCAVKLRKSFENVVLLRDASVFKSTSCKAALFDQEILGSSAWFMGDCKSSFSQAIHQIRSLRKGADPKTTTWLCDG